MHICFDTACVYFTCGTCGGTGYEPNAMSHGVFVERDWCSGCDGHKEVVVYIGTWLANLAIVALGCMGFELGRQYCWHAILDDGTPPTWIPGCQRPAPGWEER